MLVIHPLFLIVKIQTLEIKLGKGGMVAAVDQVG